MRTLMVGMALAVALAGCQATLPNLQPGNTGKPATGKVEAPPMQLAGLRFQPVSAETAAKLSQKGGMAQGAESTRAAAPAAAPAPMAAGAGVAADAAIGAKMVSPYYFGSYFSGPYGQMKLNSVTEAKAAGSTGTWKEMQTSVIAPVVAEWAADARLIQTNGSLDENGRPVQGSESYPGENAWRASYASASRGEVLEFTINAAETHVLRMQWVPINIDAASLVVDASDAVGKLTKAIGDSSFKSQEEILGKDYFFGDQQGGEVGIAVPMAATTRVNTAVAVDAPSPPEAGVTSGGSTGSAGIAVGEPAPGTMPVPPSDYQPPKEEPIFKLNAGGRWHVNLQTIGDHVVWDLSYNPGPNTPTYSYNPGDTYVDNFAYGMVNAKTGEVIRLRRPMKVTLPVAPRPMPMPVEKPKPELQ